MYEELIDRLRTYTNDGTDELRNEAADAIEELSREYESLAKTVNETAEWLHNRNTARWIPVTERLPKYGETVLVYGSQGGIYTARYERARTEWGRDSWWKLNSKSHICNPTHWMPLPEPPKEETE